MSDHVKGMTSCRPPEKSNKSEIKSNESENSLKESENLQQTCNLATDCISRQAAIDLLKQMRKDGNMIPWEGKDVFARIRKLPSAQPEPKWIPCSERLPSNEDYDETFTVTIQCEHVDGWDDYVTGYADWTPHGWDIQSYYLGQIKVTAWQPLQEPYQEGVEEYDSSIKD